MSVPNTALPLPPKEYDIEYMNRLIKQVEIALRRLNTVRPVTVGSDLSLQSAAYPISGLTIVNVPTSSTGLPSGSVWSDGGILKIVS
jgi:hypothetical protein